MQRIIIAALSIIAAILLISLASAQSAPAWSLVFAPHDVQAGDTAALTVAIAPGATTTETVTLTLPPGLQLLDAQASVGEYASDVWTFQRPPVEPATLLLTFLVLPAAQTNDDVFIRAVWHGATLKGAFILHAPGDLHPMNDPHAWLPLINHSP